MTASLRDAVICEPLRTAWCCGQMANYKVPRRVELVQTLPLNASGKVQKFELRDRVRQALAASPARPPR